MTELVGWDNSAHRRIRFWNPTLWNKTSSLKWIPAENKTQTLFYFWLVFQLIKFIWSRKQNRIWLFACTKLLYHMCKGLPPPQPLFFFVNTRLKHILLFSVYYQLEKVLFYTAEIYCWLYDYFWGITNILALSARSCQQQKNVPYYILIDGKFIFLKNHMIIKTNL